MLIQKTWNGMIYGVPTTPYWLSDFPQAPYWISSPPGDPRLLEARNWIFPPWLPKKLLIVGACYIGQQQPPNGQIAQVSFGIDRGRLCYTSGTPPWHQSGGDQQWQKLASMWLNEKQEDVFPINGPPIFVDRDKDSIWFQFDTTDYSGPPVQPRDIWIGFNYQVDTDDVIPPLTGWNPIFGPMVPMEGNAAGWTNYTISQAIDPDWFRGFVTGVGTKTRVTLAVDHISSAYIGPRVPGTLHQAASLQQLTFGGGNTGATATGGLIVSDDMPFGIDTTNGVVVQFHLVDGSTRFRIIQLSAKSYWANGDIASNPNGAGYTASVYGVNGVMNIEQFY